MVYDVQVMRVLFQSVIKMAGHVLRMLLVRCAHHVILQFTERITVIGVKVKPPQIEMTYSLE